MADTFSYFRINKTTIMKIFSATLKGTTTVSQGTTNLSGSFTGSYSGSVAGIAGDISDYSSSVALRATALEAASGSFSTRTTAIERVYATTGSNTFTAAQIIQGTLTAQTLVVQTVTSSVLFSTGSNIIGSSLSNVQQITGSVGITGSLAINGTGAIVGSGTADYVPKFTASGTIGNSQIFDNGTNVGIGTTSPTDSYSFGRALDVSGTNGAALYLRYSTSPTSQFGMIGYDRTGQGLLLATNNALPIIFSTSITERMRITSAGDVSIGTTTPLLTAASRGNLTINGASSNILTLGIAGSYSGYLFSDSTKVELSTSTQPMTFVTNGGERMRITSAGNVGIGTSAPNTRFNVADDGTTSWTPTVNNVAIFSKTASTSSVCRVAIVGGSAGVVGLDFGFTGTDNSGGIFYNNADKKMMFTTNSINERVVITSGGILQIANGVEINNANSLKLFTESNGAYWSLRTYNAASNQLRFNYQGTDLSFIATGTGNYTALSDVNKKKDFEQSQIGLNEVLGLKPTLYRMKTEADTEDKHLGFIAQEVKEFIPQAYSETGEGDDKFIGLSEMPIIAALVKAVQQQQSQIEELKTLLKA
jgi:hypothetical protein